MSVLRSISNQAILSQGKSKQSTHKSQKIAITTSTTASAKQQQQQQNQTIKQTGPNNFPETTTSSRQDYKGTCSFSTVFEWAILIVWDASRLLLPLSFEVSVIPCCAPATVFSFGNVWIPRVLRIALEAVAKVRWNLGQDVPNLVYHCW